MTSVLARPLPRKGRLCKRPEIQQRPKAGTDELDVSSSTYKQIKTGQTVQLNLKMGALGVRWYYLYDW